ncbi:MAG TPA: hypothetical protein VHC41_04910, partial [Mycobacteriales bacterium]|nr:hypothetical protein [Mycobacteriales bacterium]
MTAGLAVLAAVGVLLVLALAGTARRPAAPIPTPAEHRRRWSRLHGDLDPDANSWVSGWLAALYRVARPPARLGLSPDLLTLVGVWCAGAALTAAYGGGRWSLLAVVAVLGSGAADG